MTAFRYRKGCYSALLSFFPVLIHGHDLVMAWASFVWNTLPMRCRKSCRRAPAIVLALPAAGGNIHLPCVPLVTALWAASGDQSLMDGFHAAPPYPARALIYSSNRHRPLVFRRHPCSARPPPHRFGTQVEHGIGTLKLVPCSIRWLVSGNS
jgi:hypothetical protein